MKKLLLLIPVGAMLLVGCGSDPDAQYADKAPNSDQTNGVQPNLNKPMPGAAGSSAMESTPLRAPGK
jgi:hypothetical protein